MKPTYTTPFVPLDLSLEMKEELHRTGMSIVDGVQASFEDFLWRDKGKMDPDKWTLIRQREDLRAYEDRRPGAGTGNKDMHLVLVTGTMPGVLNDAMYGALNPTHEAMRIKTTYVQDTLIDSAVLETILLPTEELPYQSMSVRWFVKGVPLHVRAVSKHRDSVYLEGTGMRTLSTGERYGYHLKHSVEFEKTPLLPQYDRFNMSFCTIWKQATSDRIQVFTMVYLEIKDNIFVPLVMKSMADACLSVWRYTQCAQFKKLAWLVRHKSLFKSATERASIMDDGCSVCGTHSRTVKRDLKSSCAACGCYTCKKCRIKHHLSIFAPDGQLLKHEMRFCLRCVTVVKQMDAESIARDEAAGDSGQSKDPAIMSVFNGDALARKASMMSTTSSSSGEYRATASSTSSMSRHGSSQGLDRGFF